MPHMTTTTKAKLKSTNSAITGNQYSAVREYLSGKTFSPASEIEGLTSVVRCGHFLQSVSPIEGDLLSLVTIRNAHIYVMLVWLGDKQISLKFRPCFTIQCQNCDWLLNNKVPL